MVRGLYKIVSFGLALTGCAAILPVRPDLDVGVPVHAGPDHTTNPYFTDGVPLCDRGPDCSDGVRDERYGNCSYRSTMTAVLACQDDVEEDWLWCTTFQRSYQDECRGLSGADDPQGPRRSCIRVCDEMGHGMDAYECHDRHARCLSHTQFWLKACRRSCNVRLAG